MASRAEILVRTLLLEFTCGNCLSGLLSEEGLKFSIIIVGFDCAMQIPCDSNAINPIRKIRLFIGVQLIFK
jgi:hypothetical protein